MRAITGDFDIFFACFMHHSLLCFIIGSATLIPPERLKTLSRSNKRGRKRKARDKKLISLSYRCCCSSLHPVVLLYCWISFKFMVPFKKMAMNYWLPIGASSMGEKNTQESAEKEWEIARRPKKEKKSQAAAEWSLIFALEIEWIMMLPRRCQGSLTKLKWTFIGLTRSRHVSCSAETEEF